MQRQSGPDRAVGGALRAQRAWASVAVGAYTDFCVFAADSVINAPASPSPTLPAAGFEEWSEGKQTGEQPGRALRRAPQSRVVRY